jgi:hypothetical protein
MEMRPFQKETQARALIDRNNQDAMTAVLMGRPISWAAVLECLL